MSDDRYIEAESLYQQSIQAQEQGDPKQSTRLYLAAMEIQAQLPSLPLGSYKLDLGSAWRLPLQLVFCVLQRLQPAQLSIVASASITWSQVARDGELWAALFRARWGVAAPLEAALDPIKFRLPVSSGVPPLHHVEDYTNSHCPSSFTVLASHTGLGLCSDGDCSDIDLRFDGTQLTLGSQEPVDNDGIVCKDSGATVNNELQLQLGVCVTTVDVAPEVLARLRKWSVKDEPEEIVYAGPVTLGLSEHPDTPLELYFKVRFPQDSTGMILHQSTHARRSVAKAIQQIQDTCATRVAQNSIVKSRALRGSVTQLVPAHLVDWYARFRTRDATEKCFQPVCVTVGSELAHLAHVDASEVSVHHMPSVVAQVKGHYWGAGSGLQDHLVGNQATGEGSSHRSDNARNALTLQPERHSFELDASALEIIVGWAIDTWVSQVSSKVRSRGSRGDIDYTNRTIATFPVLFGEPIELLVQSEQYVSQLRKRMRDWCAQLKVPCLCMVPAPVLALCSCGMLSGVVVMPLFSGLEFVVVVVQDRQVVHIHMPEIQAFGHSTKTLKEPTQHPDERVIDVLPCCGLDQAATIKAVLETAATSTPGTNVLLWQQAAALKELLEMQSGLDIHCASNTLIEGAIAFQMMSDSVDFFQSLY